MGLFDFARNIGNKLFGSEDEAPQKIKEYIEEENPGVSNLDVSVEDGVATISGQADSAEQGGVGFGCGFGGFVRKGAAGGVDGAAAEEGFAGG